MTPEEIEISQKQQQVDALEEKLTSIESEFAKLTFVWKSKLFQQVYLSQIVLCTQNLTDGIFVLPVQAW